MNRTSSIALVLLVATASHAQLVINEVDYDQPATDTHEFIELKNTGSTPWPMNNVVVVMVSGGGATPTVYRTIGNPAWPALNPGGYFTICGDGAITPFCDEDVTPDQNLIENGAQDAIVLVNLTDSTVIDALGYEGTLAGFTEGNGFADEDPFYGGVGGSMENVSVGRWPDGADSNDNATDFAIACATPGEPNEADTSGCSLSTGLMDVHVNQPTITVFDDPASSVLWMSVEGLGDRATFEVFNMEGRLLASREVNGTLKASWAWHHAGHHGAVVVRASSSRSSVARRVVLR